MKGLFLAVVAVLGVVSVYAEQAQETAPSRVLLIWENTRFKQELIDEMKVLLEGQGYAVSVAVHSKRGMRDIDASGYDAVFITNSGAGAKVRPWVADWLKANTAHASRILLHTTKTTEWKEQVTVDAVSSASDIAAVKELAAQYTGRLSALLTPAPAAGESEDEAED